MSAKRKTTVAVIFGGRSVEHDVSVVTGSQIMRAFDPARYDVVPIYITRDGKWYTGEPLLDLNNYPNEVTSHKGVYSAILSPSTQHHGLIINPVSNRFQKNSVQRLDVVFPALHGTHGEDGTLQGLLEMADIPYVGAGVLASALSNDKAYTKMILRQHGIPVAPDLSITRAEWLDNPEAVLAHIRAQMRFPLFVKPVALGSSIGVAHVSDEQSLRSSIDIAANFDHRVLIEAAVSNATEVNCAVMGQGSQVETSVLEQPVSWQEFLTYEEKYLRGGEGMKSAERIIPAPLSEDLTLQVRQLAAAAFRAIDGRGTARIDFLVSSEDVYVNEINTLPGSLAFYLWQESGMRPVEVVDRLVRLATDAAAEKRRTSYDYQTDLINLTAQRGLKGAKGTKSSANPRGQAAASQR